MPYNVLYDSNANKPGKKHPGALGVTESSQETSQGGAAGFFGAKEGFNTYTAEDTSGDQTFRQREADNRAMIQNRANAVQAGTIRQISGLPNKAAGAVAGKTDQSAQAEARAGQMRLAQALELAANGQGPSAAQVQLQRGRDQNIAQAFALANSARGVNPLGAQRAAMANASQASQIAAGQAAELRANEIAQARGQLAGVLEQGRAGDMNVAQMAQQNAQFNAGQEQQNNQFNAGLQQDTAKTNLGAAIEQTKTRDALVQQYMAMGLTYDQAMEQSAVQQRQFNAGLLAQQTAAAHGVSIQNNAQSAQTAGAIMSALGTAAAAMSDERVKTDIEPGEKKLGQFLSEIGTHSYKYKDKKHGAGEYVSPMAQELERTELGKHMVIETPEGKAVDYGKGLGAMLASLSMLNKKVARLEAA